MAERPATFSFRRLPMPDGKTLQELDLAGAIPVDLPDLVHTSPDLPLPSRGSRFIIVQQIEPYTSKPFRIIETYPTSDGIRTRVIGGSFATTAEARLDVAKRAGQ